MTKKMAAKTRRRTRPRETVESPGAPSKLPSGDPALYEGINDWFRAVQGRVPLQMAAGIQQLMNAESITFHEAYARLVDSGNIIPIEPKRSTRSSAKPKKRSASGSGRKRAPARAAKSASAKKSRNR